MHYSASISGRTGKLKLASHCSTDSVRSMGGKGRFEFLQRILVPFDPDSVARPITAGPHSAFTNGYTNA